MSRVPDSEDIVAAFRLHYDAILGYAFRMTGDRDEAEDVASQAFLALAEQVRAGRFPPDVRPWLYRSTYNAVVSRSRRRQTRLNAVGDVWRWLTGTGGPPQPTDRLQAASRQEAVRVALLRLSLEDRQVIVLRYDEEMDFATIATVTGLTEGSVRSRLSRALDRLRESLKEAGVDA